MQNTDFQTGTIKPVEIYKEAWAIMKERYWLVFGIVIVGLLLKAAAEAAKAAKAARQKQEAEQQQPEKLEGPDQNPDQSGADQGSGQNPQDKP